MALPSSNRALDSTLRLSGLKSVAGKKVRPESELPEDLGDYSLDVGGTAPPPVEDTQNIPESDMGGELTSQGYDVRANEVTLPDEQRGFFSRFGQALSDYVSPSKRAEMETKNRAMMGMQQPEQAVPQAPPIETAQVDMQEGLPPVTASQEKYSPPVAPEASPGFFGALKDYVSPTKNMEYDAYNKQLVDDAQLLSQGKNPNEIKQDYHDNFKKNVEKAMENPGKHSVYGSASEVENSPVLKAEFKKVTGTDYEPQIAAQVKEHELAMKGVEDSLNGINTKLGEREEGIKQRILSNQATDADKYYIGLALLLPLLIGGMFGKEAGLGALGGGAQGVADILTKREKQNREDETSLLDINKQQALNNEKLANMSLEKAKLGPSLRKLIPEDKEKHLKDREYIEVKNPKTGEVEKGYRLLPNFVAKGQYVTSQGDVNDMKKSATKLAEVKGYVDEITDLTDDVIEMVSQLDERDKSLFKTAIIASIEGKAPGVLSKLSKDVMLDGKKVNAGIMLKNKLGLLTNAYGHAKDLGQADRAMQSHVKTIFDNPTASFLTPEDVINQMLAVRKLGQEGLVRDTENQGFYPEFLMEDIEKKNKGLFSRLNSREDQKYKNEITTKIHQGDVKYAQ